MLAGAKKILIIIITIIIIITMIISDTKQSVWDRPGIMAVQAVVMSAFAENFNRARLLAASAPHSGD